MGKKAKLKRPIRYRTTIFKNGTIGDIVTVPKPPTFRCEPVYDYYIKFGNHKPIGVLKAEVDILEDNEG